MTRRKDELRPRLYNDLLYHAADLMQADALQALEKYQAIRERGHSPQILFSPHHGWVVRGPMEGMP